MTFSLDFFAALRRMKAGAADPPVPVLPDTDTPRPMAAGRSPGAIGSAGLELIKRFEGCARARPDGRFEAYIELKWPEVLRWETTPSAVEFDMYYSA